MENHKDNTTKRHHTTTTNNHSMSDTDSQFDEFHSPLRSLQQPEDDLPSSPSKAIVAVNKYYSPVGSPPSNHHHQKPNQPAVAYNRSVREEAVTGKVNPDGGGGERRLRTDAVVAPVRRVKREVVVERLGLGFRVSEMVLCLIAFSVMASDKTQGWSGDSFDRYKEYRYVVAVNAIGFAYAAFQAIDMTYLVIYGKHIIAYYLRPHFDFMIDQMLAYLLISASSSAATRVDDWVSNWGKDHFTEMATASIGMSFLAFLAFAFSSLVSGYNLCNQSSL